MPLIRESSHVFALTLVLFAGLLQTAIGASPACPTSGDLDVPVGAECTLTSAAFTYNIVNIAGTLKISGAVEIHAVNVTIASTGLIDGNTGGVKGVSNEISLQAGASHGGIGSYGAAYVDNKVNAPYGDFRDPRDIGKGSIDVVGMPGAHGGAAIYLDVSDTLVLDGNITVDGERPRSDIPDYASGGGAGGSISIDAETLASATGHVSANGGNGGIASVSTPLKHGYGGSGGRISIRCMTSFSSILDDLSMSAIGGSRFDWTAVGGAGTIYVDCDTTGNTLIIDNGDYFREYTQSSLVLDAGSQDVHFSTVYMRKSGELAIWSPSVVSTAHLRIDTVEGDLTGRIHISPNVRFDLVEPFDTAEFLAGSEFKFDPSGNNYLGKNSSSVYLDNTNAILSTTNVIVEPDGILRLPNVTVIKDVTVTLQGTLENADQVTLLGRANFEVIGKSDTQKTAAAIKKFRVLNSASTFVNYSSLVVYDDMYLEDSATFTANHSDIYVNGTIVSSGSVEWNFFDDLVQCESIILQDKTKFYGSSVFLNANRWINMTDSFSAFTRSSYSLNASNIIFGPSAQITCDGSSDNTMGTGMGNGDGASYGGYGLTSGGETFISSPMPYDIFNDIQAFGSKGMDSPSAAAGWGGGQVAIHASNSLWFDGTVSSNGGDGEDGYDGAGGGSGGAVLVETSVLESCNGSISIVGGAGGFNTNSAGKIGGSGSGGRSSFRCANDRFSLIESLIVRAHGGRVRANNGRRAGPGTSYIDCGALNESLRIDNFDSNTTISAASAVIANAPAFLEITRAEIVRGAGLEILRSEPGAASMVVIDELTGDNTGYVQGQTNQTIKIGSSAEPYAYDHDVLGYSNIPASHQWDIVGHRRTYSDGARSGLTRTSLIIPTGGTVELSTSAAVAGSHLDISGTILSLDRLLAGNGSTISLRVGSNANLSEILLMEGSTLHTDVDATASVDTLYVWNASRIIVDERAFFEIFGNATFSDNSQLLLKEQSTASADGSIHFGKHSNVTMLPSSSWVVQGDVVFDYFVDFNMTSAMFTSTQGSLIFSGDSILGLTDTQIMVQDALRILDSTNATLNGVVRLWAGTIEICENCVLNGTAGGYAPAQGPGRGLNCGDGASYAGHGVNAAGQLRSSLGYDTVGGPYGQTLQPSSLGSGGAYACDSSNNQQSDGGVGGAALHLNVSGTLTINGIIEVDGAYGLDYSVPNSIGGGGGSGGSIWIDAGVLSAPKALLSASGGSGGYGRANYGGGGSGGRVSVSCDAQVSNTVQEWEIDTFGGYFQASPELGAATGTIYIDCPRGDPTINVDNGLIIRDQSAPAYVSWDFNSTDYVTIDTRNYASVLFIPQSTPSNYDLHVRRLTGDGKGYFEVNDGQHVYFPTNQPDSYQDLRGAWTVSDPTGTPNSFDLSEINRYFVDTGNRSLTGSNVIVHEGAIVTLPQYFSLHNASLHVYGRVTGVEYLTMSGTAEIYIHNNGAFGPSLAVPAGHVQLQQLQLEEGSNFTIGNQIDLTIATDFAVYNASSVTFGNQSHVSVGAAWIGDIANFTVGADVALEVNTSLTCIRCNFTMIDNTATMFVHDTIHLEHTRTYAINDTLARAAFKTIDSTTDISLYNSTLGISDGSISTPTSIYLVYNTSLFAFGTTSVYASNLYIDEQSSVNGTARGFSGGLGFGTGTYIGHGASGGGYGADENDEMIKEIVVPLGSSGGPYGDYNLPTSPGSGGAHGTNCRFTSPCLGGAGGAAIALHVSNVLHLSGQILANAEDGKNDWSSSDSESGGGGSGGSILINATKLEGSYAQLQANGGNGIRGRVRGGGSGSGGRIAVHCPGDSSDSLANLAVSTMNTSVAGGYRTDDVGPTGGAPGTVYFVCGVRQHWIMSSNGAAIREQPSTGVMFIDSNSIEIERISLVNYARLDFAYNDAGTIKYVDDIRVHQLYMRGQSGFRIRSEQTITLVTPKDQFNETINKRVRIVPAFPEARVRTESGNEIVEISQVDRYIEDGSSLSFSETIMTIDAGGVLVVPSNVMLNNGTWDVHGTVSGVAHLAAYNYSTVNVHNDGVVSPKTPSEISNDPSLTGTMRVTNLVVAEESSVRIAPQGDLTIFEYGVMMNQSYIEVGSDSKFSVGRLDVAQGSLFNASDNIQASINQTLLVEDLAQFAFGNFCTLSIGETVTLRDANVSFGQSSQVSVLNGSVSLYNASWISNTMTKFELGNGNLTINPGSRFDMRNTTAFISDTLFLDAGALLNVSGVTHINANHIFLTPGSRVFGNGGGYPEEDGPGAGISYHHGAAHASHGSNANGEPLTFALGTQGSPYGSGLYPTTMGSGGSKGQGSGCCAGGAGGAALFLEALDDIRIDADISMNGDDGAPPPSTSGRFPGGGGAGGSILVQAPTLLSASGVMTANGGVGPYGTSGTGGGGSGGRIAIHCDSDPFDSISNLRVEAIGGEDISDPRLAAGPGSLYIDCGEKSQFIRVANGNKNRLNVMHAYIFDGNMSTLEVKRLELFQGGGIKFTPPTSVGHSEFIVQDIEGDSTGELAGSNMQTMRLASLGTVQSQLGLNDTGNGTASIAPTPYDVYLEAQQLVELQNPVRTEVQLSSNTWKVVHQRRFFGNGSWASLKAVSVRIDDGATIDLPERLAIKDCSLTIDGLVSGIADLALAGNASVVFGYNGKRVGAPRDRYIALSSLQMAESSRLELPEEAYFNISRFSFRNETVILIGNRSEVHIGGDLDLYDSASFIVGDDVPIYSDGNTYLYTNSTLKMGKRSRLDATGSVSVFNDSMVVADQEARILVGGNMTLNGGSVNGSAQEISVQDNLIMTNGAEVWFTGSATIGKNTIMLDDSVFFVQHSGRITSNYLEMASGTRISGDYMGYGESQGPGAGQASYEGAAHSGYGTNRLGDILTYALGSTGSPYGNTESPTQPGSGGAAGYSIAAGGSGGAAIRITVNRLLLNGTITARGKDGESTSRGGGGGSGGSIFIESQILEASYGKLYASGGAGGIGSSYDGGGGSGGRISFGCTNDAADTIRKVAYEAAGGLSGRSPTMSAGPGTIFLNCGSRARYLRVDNKHPDLQDMNLAYIRDSQSSVVYYDVDLRNNAGLSFVPAGVTGETKFNVIRVYSDNTGKLSSIPQQSVYLGTNDTSLMERTALKYPTQSVKQVENSTWAVENEHLFHLDGSFLSVNSVGLEAVSGSTWYMSNMLAFSGSSITIDGAMYGLQHLALSRGAKVTLGPGARLGLVTRDDAVQLSSLHVAEGSSISFSPNSQVTVEARVTIQQGSTFACGSDSDLRIKERFIVDDAIVDLGDGTTLQVDQDWTLSPSSTLTIGDSSLIGVQRDWHMDGVTYSFGDQMDITVGRDLYMQDSPGTGEITALVIARDFTHENSDLYLRDCAMTVGSTVTLRSSRINLHMENSMESNFFYMDELSVIEGSENGYSRQSGPGAGLSRQYGASHAGFGFYGHYNDNYEQQYYINQPGGVYGSTFAPLQAGSGGRNGQRSDMPGGAGGAAIHVKSRVGMSFNGTINVNAQDGDHWSEYFDHPTSSSYPTGSGYNSHWRNNQQSYYTGSGGSGGSIWLESLYLYQSHGIMNSHGGSARANGRMYTGGAGSGGRIALACTEDLYGTVSNITSASRGGYTASSSQTSSYTGAAPAGTRYFDCGSRQRELHVDNQPDYSNIEDTYVIDVGSPITFNKVWSGVNSRVRLASFTTNVVISILRGDQTGHIYVDAGQQFTFGSNITSDVYPLLYATVFASQDNGGNWTVQPTLKYVRDGFNDSLSYVKLDTHEDGHVNFPNNLLSRGINQVIDCRMTGAQDITVVGRQLRFQNKASHWIRRQSPNLQFEHLSVIENGVIYFDDGRDIIINKNIMVGNSSRIYLYDNTHIVTHGRWEFFDSSSISIMNNVYVDILDRLDIFDSSALTVTSDTATIRVVKDTTAARDITFRLGGCRMEVGGDLNIQEGSNVNFGNQADLYVNGTVRFTSTSIDGSIRNGNVKGNTYLTGVGSLELSSSQLNIGGFMQLINSKLQVQKSAKINAQDFGMDASSLIDANAAGYLAQSGPGFYTGLGFGASHGGSGVYGYGSTSYNYVYGNFTHPTEMGSGGDEGRYCCTGGRGGGAIHIVTTRSMLIDGQILVNGESGVYNSYDSNSYGAGGGSGGSILLETNIWNASTGTLKSNGATGSFGSQRQGGASGGGRIAVHCKQDISQSIRLLQTGAEGGITLTDDYLAGAGTIWYDCGEYSRYLKVQNRESGIRRGRTYALFPESVLFVDTVDITSLVQLVFEDASRNSNAKTNVTITYLRGDISSMLYVNNHQNMTLARSATTAQAPLDYVRPAAVMTNSSSVTLSQLRRYHEDDINYNLRGPEVSTSSTSRLILAERVAISTTLTVNGILEGVEQIYGSGEGQLYLRTSGRSGVDVTPGQFGFIDITLEDNATLQLDNAMRLNISGILTQRNNSRVVVEPDSTFDIRGAWNLYDNSQFVGSDRVNLLIDAPLEHDAYGASELGNDCVFTASGWSLSGGAVWTFGQRTTIMLSNDLYLNNARITGYPELVSANMITLEDAVVSVSQGNLTAATWMKITKSSTVYVSAVSRVLATDLLLDGTSLINGTAEGDSTGPGYYGTTGYGGSHGGPGSGRTGNVISSSYTYGTYKLPATPGSGGRSGSGSAAGGKGGAAILINVQNTATLDGNIVVDGGDGLSITSNNYAGGGGSGGSILVQLGHLKKSRGFLSANGGNGGTSGDTNEFGGAGGGGRIAMYCNGADSNAIDEVVGLARGGMTLYNGLNDSPASPGTVYFDCGSRIEYLFIDNGDKSYPDRAAYVVEDDMDTLAVQTLHIVRSGALFFVPRNLPSGTSTIIQAGRMNGDQSGVVHVRSDQSLIVAPGGSNMAASLYELQYPTANTNQVSSRSWDISQTRRFYKDDTFLSLAFVSVEAVSGSTIFLPSRVTVAGTHLHIDGGLAGVDHLLLAGGATVLFQGNSRVLSAGSARRYIFDTVQTDEGSSLSFPDSTNLRVRGSMVQSQVSTISFGQESNVTIDQNWNVSHGSTLSSGARNVYNVQGYMALTNHTTVDLGDGSHLSVMDSFKADTSTIKGPIANFTAKSFLMEDGTMHIRNAMVQTSTMLDIFGSASVYCYNTSTIYSPHIRIGRDVMILGNGLGEALSGGHGRGQVTGEGASHAGYGLKSTGAPRTTSIPSIGSPYNYAIEPLIIPGSNGGPGTYLDNGLGGAAINITANNTLTINGTISMGGTNAEDNPSYTNSRGAGGGSGGTIYIKTNTLYTSFATLLTHGGNGGDGRSADGGGGSGGRMAFVCSNDMQESAANISAFSYGGITGTNPLAAGAPGTFYIECGTLNDLLVDNGNSSRGQVTSYVLDPHKNFTFGYIGISNSSQVDFIPQDSNTTNIHYVQVGDLGGDGTGELEVSTNIAAIFEPNNRTNLVDQIKTVIDISGSTSRRIRQAVNVSVESFSLTQAQIRITSNGAAYFPRSVFVCDYGSIYSDGALYGIRNITFCEGHPNPSIQGTTSIYGCTNVEADNYNPAASIDDNSCAFNTTNYGCTYSIADNYDPIAVVNDGTCTLPAGHVSGCMCQDAYNFDPSATLDDGSCAFASASDKGCIYVAATNYDPYAKMDDGSCTFEDPTPILDAISELDDEIDVLQAQINNVTQDLTVVKLENKVEEAAYQETVVAEEKAYNATLANVTTCLAQNETMYSSIQPLTTWINEGAKNLSTCQGILADLEDTRDELQSSLDAIQTGGVLPPNQWVRFAVSAATVVPDKETISVELTREPETTGGSLTGSIAVLVETQSGTAKPNIDYVPFTQLVVFEALETSATLQVAVIRDPQRSSELRFTLRIVDAFSPPDQNTALLESVRSGVRSLGSSLDVRLQASTSTIDDAELQQDLWWQLWMRRWASTPIVA